MTFADKLKEYISPYYKLKPNDVILKKDMAEFDDKLIQIINNGVWLGIKSEKLIKHYNDENHHRKIVSILRKK